MRETRLLMICPTSDITPEMLARTIHSMDSKVALKETCYGCLIEGEAEDVRKITNIVRNLGSNSIFSKRRAYRLGDPVRCRAQHGTRPGFSQLEEEWDTLTLIKKGLDACDSGIIPKQRPKSEKLPVSDFKKICEAYK